MPEMEVVLFVEADGTCPLLNWMDGLPPKVQDKCIVRVERLAEMGHELRRPEADYLGEGIYELRASYRGIHYRILYFFHGTRAVISQGWLKKGQYRSVRSNGRFAAKPFMQVILKNTLTGSNRVAQKEDG